MRCEGVLRVAFTIVCACAAFPRPVGAVCVMFPWEQAVARDSTVAVFSGTVDRIEAVPAGQVVTVVVDRVWKGQVAPRTIVYNRQMRGATEQITLVRGTRYFVMAYRPVPEERESFGLPADAGDVVATNYCTTYEFGRVRDAGFWEDIDRAPSHPPR